MTTPFHNADGLAVHNGDVIDMLAHLEPGSIDAVVTSPPYAMQRKSTYGGVPEKEYPDWTVAWMEALRPALKDTGSVIINISPHRHQGNLSDYVLRTRLALRDDGWLEPDELIWHKTNSTPGAPANRPRRAWEHLLWFARSNSAYSDPHASAKPYVDDPTKRGSFTGDSPSGRMGWAHKRFNYGKSEIRKTARVTNVASFAKSGRTGFPHPAPFPVQLAEWCAKLICPTGGTVLDPFAGSGTTAVAALRNGFQSVAIEREPEYAQMIVDRYNAELAKRNDDGGLFAA